MAHPLRGVYAAVVTPYDENGQLDEQAFVSLLQHLTARGMHGVLVAGTTGEGPSLTIAERIRLFVQVHQAHDNLRLLAGTGAASLQDSIQLSRAAFDQGASGIVVIPPFFYLEPSEEGLFCFYQSLIQAAVPSDGAVLLYHNPFVSAPPITHTLIARLLDAFPNQLAGIKDSSGNWDYTQTLLRDIPNLQVLLGSDKIMAQGLEAGAAGGITALAGVFPDLLRGVFDAHSDDDDLDSSQQRLSTAHQKFDGLPRIQAYKWLLRAGNLIPAAQIRPPLRPLTPQEIEFLSERFHLNVPVPQTIDMKDISPLA